MSEPQAEVPDVYLAGRIREALAEDPRLAELNVDVAVSHDRIVLTGHVSTADRRDIAADVAGLMAGDRQIVNQLDVTGVEGPPGVEEIA